MNKDFKWYITEYTQKRMPRNRGTIFERAMQIYLCKEPIQAERFSKVLTWAEWVDYYCDKYSKFPYPSKHNDIGIDLVAIKKDNTYTAIQCKFRGSDEKLYKSDLDSFFATVNSDKGKKYFNEKILIDTGFSYSTHLQNLIADNHDCIAIGLAKINESKIDWAKWFETNEVVLKKNFEPFPYQKEAIKAVVNGFNSIDEAGNTTTRGKLIMACGTGKTFVSLKITEQLIQNQGLVLFLVPSLALIDQTVKTWTHNATNPTKKIVVCSASDTAQKYDSKEDNLMTPASDLYVPLTSEPVEIAKSVNAWSRKQVVVIFSTYHSLKQIETAQKEYQLPEFDLIICDEAHRTSTNPDPKKKGSFFTAIHKNSYVSGKKRLYMTATPKIYVEQVKKDAEKLEVALFSMDDEIWFGKKFYEYSFAKAIRDEKLTDYRIVLAAFDLNDYKKVTQSFASNLKIKEYLLDRFKKNKESEKNKKIKQVKQLCEEDFYKLIAVYKQFCKIGATNDQYTSIDDPGPMKKVMGFISSVNLSEDVKDLFPQIVHEYQKDAPASEKDNLIELKVDHISGKTASAERANILNDLDNIVDNTCKMITNVNCLSEGVDVPSLDGVVFLQPRQSQINIIQCIGRVLRTAPGKKWGYILIPIFVPPGRKPEDVLHENKEYKRITRVINTLRSIDEDFNTEIQNLSLNPNGKIPEKIIGIGSNNDQNINNNEDVTQNKTLNLIWDNDDFSKAIKAVLIRQTVDSDHWEDWVDDVATKAKKNRGKIKSLINSKSDIKDKFNQLKAEMQNNIHTSIKSDDVVDMVNQHFITEPIFNALFENSGALTNNVIANSLNEFITKLKTHGITLNDDSAYQDFYNAIKRKVSSTGEDPKARQNLLHKIYENFFTKAFPRDVAKLGLVYTPTEVINFMLHSVDYLLQTELNTKLENDNVSIIDPFTGTGSYLTQLINATKPNGEYLISDEKLQHKYQHEIFANEIMLLPYYIASVNIAHAFYTRTNEHLPFNGICLTDTFAAYEDTYKHQKNEYRSQILNPNLLASSLTANYNRLQVQKSAQIKVIIGNPPYSGTSDANQDNANETYKNLEAVIKKTYNETSSSTSNVVLKNSYVKAIKWAELRLQDVDQGIIAFITPNSFLKAVSCDGMRHDLSAKFASIYIFDCKGDNRLKIRSGSTDQGGPIFAGKTVSATMTFFIKNKFAAKQGQIYYYTFSEILKTSDKLKRLEQLNSFKSIALNLKHSEIDANHDWINQDKTNFTNQAYFLPLRQKIIGSKAKGTYKELFTNFIFNHSSCGVSSSRNFWCSNFSKTDLADNMQKTINYYNQKRKAYQAYRHNSGKKTVRAWLDKDNDSKKIAWSKGLQNNLNKNQLIKYNPNNIIYVFMRPFSTMQFYFDNYLNESRYQLPYIFKEQDQVLGMMISSQNHSACLSALATNKIMDYDFIDKCIYFPLKYKTSLQNTELVQNNNSQTIEVINDNAIALFQYPNYSVTKEMLFYYIYGIFNQKAYSLTFKNAITKQLPRVPKVRDITTFKKFVTIGKQLADLHVNFETYLMWETPAYDPNIDYRTEDFIIGNIDKNGKKTGGITISNDYSTITYNDKFILRDIPPQAWNYKLMNKSIIELFINKHKIKTDKKSVITHDPNDYGKEIGNPRYLLETLLRVINIALKTDELKNQLPDVDLNDLNNLEKFFIK